MVGMILLDVAFVKYVVCLIVHIVVQRFKIHIVLKLLLKYDIS